jgi:hypothetical protein
MLGPGGLATIRKVETSFTKMNQFDLHVASSPSKRLSNLILGQTLSPPCLNLMPPLINPIPLIGVEAIST